MHTAVATTQPEFRNRWQRFRQRQREGRRVYPLDLDEELVLGALVEAGLLTEAEVASAEQVQQKLADVLHEWARGIWYVTMRRRG